ncbi:MAG: MFS transporter [Deltaproteobacteria bacterium]|nr:MFS transporter [Deltaproteobacteria bacterium]
MTAQDVNPKQLSSNATLTLTAMSLGFAVVQLDVTVVNVAVKSIGSSFGGGIAGLQWVVNAYTVVFASFILTSGALGDRLGAKRLFIIGFAIFVIASICCGMALSLTMLIGFRAIQGIGAAILVPCSLTLLNHTYQEAESRDQAVGIWAGVAGVALAGGPVLGGALIATIGWRAIFFINVPLGALGIWLTARYASESTRTSDRPLDFTGQLAAVAGVAVLAAAMIEGGAIGWTNALVITGFIVFVMATGAFLAIEARKTSPMLPLSFFRNHTFTATSIVGFLINLAFYGLIFDLSLYWQQIKKFTPLITGLAFMPMTVIVVVANILAGYASTKLGARAPIVVGQLIFAVGCFLLLRIDVTTHYGALWWETVLIGAGIGLTVPPMTSALLGTVDRKQSGVASGVLNTTRQIGSVIGVALFGSLIANRTHFVAGLQIAFCIAGIVAFIGAAAAMIMIRKDSAFEDKESYIGQSVRYTR